MMNVKYDSKLEIDGLLLVVLLVVLLTLFGLARKAFALVEAPVHRPLRLDLTLNPEVSTRFAVPCGRGQRTRQPQTLLEGSFRA